MLRRPWHQLDIITLSDALLQSQLCRPECSTNRCIDEVALLYDSELSSLLDSMVPVATVTCRQRSSDPWFDQECRLKKRAVQRLELISCSFRTPLSTSAWIKERRIYRSLHRNKRESFWMLKIDTKMSSPRQLWRLIDVLLVRGGVPSCDNIDVVQFNDYFDTKVTGVRFSTDGPLPPSFTMSILRVSSQSPLTKWSLFSECYLTRAVLLIHFRLKHSSQSSMLLRLFD